MVYSLLVKFYPAPSAEPGSCLAGALLTHLESTLVEVFILKNLNLFRINSYEKPGGVGVLVLTRHPTKCARPACPELLGEPTSGSENAARWETGPRYSFVDDSSQKSL